jgi:flagellar M-ring protein FliF
MADNTSIQQAQNFYTRLTGWQKGLIIAVPIIIITGIIILIATAGGSNNEDMKVLYSDLNATDAAKITEELKEQKIDYKLEDGGSTILVSQDKVFQTRLDLANAGLPENSTAGYELFDKTNLGMSEFVQKLNYRRALEGELSKTINSLDEVKKSRVHIVIPENALFKEDQKNPSASVTLHLESGRSISKISIEGIQTLVSSSIEGMQPGQVSVTDQRGKLLSDPPLDETTVAGLTAMQHEQQRRVEQHLEQKAQAILNAALGADNSQVSVTADLDFTKIEQNITDYDPDRQVVRSEQQIVEKSESQDSLSYPAVNMAKDQSNSIQNYEIKKVEEHIVHSVGTVQRLSVSAMVNGKYEVVTNEEGLRTYQYIPRTEEEMNKLNELVKNAVGYDPERNDNVSVLNIPFENIYNEDDIKQLNPEPWYLQPQNQKIFFLLAAIIIAILLMYTLLQSKIVKDRVRIALSLPEKVKITEDDLEDEEDEEEELEELDLDEDDLLLLPAELPETLLLEGDRDEEEPEDLLESGEEDADSLAAKARAELDDSEAPELTEDAMMKIEMKQKVESFAEEQTEEAARLIRLFMVQSIND